MATTRNRQARPSNGASSADAPAAPPLTPPDLSRYPKEFLLELFRNVHLKRTDCIPFSCLLAAFFCRTGLRHGALPLRAFGVGACAVKQVPVTLRAAA